MCSKARYELFTALLPRKGLLRNPQNASKLSLKEAEKVCHAMDYFQLSNTFAVIFFKIMLHCQCLKDHSVEVYIDSYYALYE